MGDLISIEVVDARAHGTRLIALQVVPGTTLHQAAVDSGLLPPGQTSTLGVFGRVCAPETPVCAGDRVEIYRALINDPKHARRQRARKT